MSDSKTSKGFGRTYWMLNSIEAFERLAYFSIRAVVPIYIMQATEPGGLHLTAIHKGWIYAWWAFFQSFLPMFTGGFADRFGYKRVMAMSISMNVMGYLMMAYLTNYYGFFSGVILLATGTAFFKPSLQGSLAQSLNKNNSSLGWGVFYWVVNIGAVTAPVLATMILGRPHSAEGWQNLFLFSAAYTSCNFLLLLTFKDVSSGASKTDSVLVVLKKTLTNIAEPRLIAWLLIMSCFWLMMYQLWDLHPNFIEDWVDSSAVAQKVPFESWKEYGDRGLLRVPQQILLNLNAAMIVALILPISWLVRKMRTLESMLIGMSVATIGVLVAGLTGNGWVLLLGIVFFSLGEMLTGPKKNEYLGLIAPPGKKGLYLGYVNIPVGVGVGIGSIIAGFVYDNYGEKATLALKHLNANQQLLSRATQSCDWSDSLDLALEISNIKRDKALFLAAKSLETDEITAGKKLLERFRYDKGQIENLALEYLALHDDFKGDVKKELKEEVSESLVAKHVGKLEKATGIKRFAAIDRVRYLDREYASLDDETLGEKLWERFGNNRENITNLAIEYLAQGTPLLSDAAAKVELGEALDELKEKLGIGRTKSFMALSAATAMEPGEAMARLDELYSDVDPDYRALVYLIEKKHVRFLAVHKRDWKKNVDLLKRLIEKDPKALEEKKKRNLDYKELAQDNDATLAVLDKKNWKKSPLHAAVILGLNPDEAQIKAAAELSDAYNKTTQMLWKKYNPQYKVWLPFAFIGVLAAIALAIFGKKAKKWKDMNA